RLRRRLEQATAALASGRNALAELQPGALERQGLGLAPRRVVEVDACRRLARGHLVAELDQRLEQAAVGGVDIVVVAAELGEAGRCWRRNGSLQQADMRQHATPAVLCGLERSRCA